MNSIKKHKVGQEIRMINPRTGDWETGEVTAYAYTTVNTKNQQRGTSGVMVKFLSNEQPVEIDGAFL